MVSGVSYGGHECILDEGEHGPCRGAGIDDVVDDDGAASEPAEVVEFPHVEHEVPEVESEVYLGGVLPGFLEVVE